MKPKFWAIATLAVTVPVLLSLTLCNREKGIRIESARISRGSITESVSVLGHIRPVREVKISPDVSGEIVELLCSEGQHVRKGDLLIKIRQDQYISGVRRAEASLAGTMSQMEAQRAETLRCEADFLRCRNLFEQEAVSSAEYETAELNLQAARSRMEEYHYQVESARAILEEARDELSRTLIYAPAGGIISSLDVELGERVVGTSQMAGTEMLRIADYDRMELRVEVSEGDVFKMHHGDSVSIRLDARPDIPLSGRVSRIASAATPSWTTPGTTNFKVRISIDNQHITKLLPGMSATASIFTCTKYDILTIPLQCIFEKDGRETVWRIDSRMRAHAIPVQCGIRDIYSIEVVSGLDEGDVVATGPYSIVTRTLCEGDIVYDPHYDE